MRSLSILNSSPKVALAAFAASLLAGCLVSEDPVLDAKSGAASPLPDGDYAACNETNGDEDCTVFAVSRGQDDAYTLQAGDEEPATLRFRRIARKAYAVQSAEDDGFAYYYGAGDSEEFSLILMECPDLPEKLRARLIAKGDLSTGDEDFETCRVNTVKGLVEAAKAYRRGDATGDETARIVLKPVPQQAGD